MPPHRDDQPAHLSQISTLWSKVFEAHGEEAEAAYLAQDALMQRYWLTIHRYLRCVVRNDDVADELFQEFALQFVRGGFRHADPGKGRFRDYLKVTLLRLVSRYRRRQASRIAKQTDVAQRACIEDAPEDLEASLVACCRDDHLKRAWSALEQQEQQTGRPLFTVLDLRARHPNVNSTEMAADISRRLNLEQPLTAAGVRKLLERARRKFADLLVADVAETLGSPTAEQVELELIELGLHSYCRSALKR